MSIISLLGDIRNKESSILISLGKYGTDYIDIICDEAAAVLVNPEEYMEYGADGFSQMRTILDYAREKGLYTITDCRKMSFEPRLIVKGIHSDGYIINESYGTDKLQNFIFEINRNRKTLFGSMRQKSIIYEFAGQGLSESSYSNLGITTSLDDVQQTREIRKRLSMSMFIIENYDSIRTKYAIVRSHFKRDCTGALVLLPAEKLVNSQVAEKYRTEINKTVDGGILR